MPANRLSWLPRNPLGRLREHLRETRRLAEETRLVVEQTRLVVEQTRLVVDGQGAALERIETRLHELSSHAHTQTAQLERVIEALRLIHAGEHWRREHLHDLRSDPSYELPYSEPDPLVSVVIQTYDNHRLLRERSLPSVLAQTHQNFEIVVVGDAAPEEARLAAESFGDARIRVSNLPYRGPYPDDDESRWRVAGIPPYNEGVRLARGLWIAPLGDDDAFRPEHLERLLAHAREQRLELAYSRQEVQLPGERPATPVPGIPNSDIVGRFPPEHGEFALQSAIYHHGLGRIFELERADGALGLPADWGLCLRMMESGVRIGMLDEVTVDYYPGRAWGGANPDA